MVAERPPAADGQWGWWDSSSNMEDTISPARGERHPFSSGTYGNCPDVATYRFGNYQDNCMFNAPWSCHPQGGNFCMGDGSVRSIAYLDGNQSTGSATLLEDLASRDGNEVIASNF